jgi:hypothetical protein
MTDVGKNEVAWAIEDALNPLIEPGVTTTLRKLAAASAVAAIAAHKAALAEAGYVIVPRKLTEPMLQAWCPDDDPDAQRLWGDVLDAAVPEAERTQ